MRIVIIGGVAAGAKAAAKAKRVNPDLEVIVFQDEAEVAYSACGLPYVIGGTITDQNKLVIRRPEEFAKDGIQVNTGHRVVALDTANRRMMVRNLQDQSEESIAYDRLIVATGALPIVPRAQGIDLDGVLTLRKIGDLARFKSVFDTLRPQKAVIVGAGYIGMELAEAFHELNIETTIVEKFPRILPKFDPEMAQMVHDQLVEQNIELILGDGLSKLQGKNGRVIAVVTESGKILPADLVVIAIGVRPNTELAQAAGIMLGTTGAIAVDTRMETNIPGVFAAGDCAETIDRVAGQPVWMPFGDIANLQGRVAGENAAGGNAHFPGVFGTAIFKVFDLNVAMTGLSEQAARAQGFDPVSVLIRRGDRARYYPGGREVTIKLIADRRDGRLLGAQVIGPGKTDKMIDIAATALLGKLTCHDLENADLAYSPPFSPVLSPMIMAAGALSSRLSGRMD
ncbi:FAD-dependent oxidoreductase [Methylomicrobium sp. Wu6]|uniref:FAD-dependent oxidoreductase n=1 Tax=Methylomicrobium sp. Wu6 TaxID=3107928 RepID=UPI002DD6808D|nr:FAD-dependent oxidoreductase [Methylomicrobium sp. Wu6]MEC4749543.1 FAD-dependent oxidoreductase [Methylomicrobium sp. Wu6]